MSIILCIDTTQKEAFICLSNESNIIAKATNNEQYSHANWLHTAINDLLAQQQLHPSALQAVAVSNGPGSYTGLRVGLSTAKGLCHALNIPLITVSTLEQMANAVKEEAEDLICAVIDARRMEVYAAIFDKNMNAVLSPTALIIEEHSFSHLLSTHKILFTGNGAEKVKNTINHSNIKFSVHHQNMPSLAEMAAQLFKNQQFAELAYAEPFYIKDFYSTTHK